MIAVYLAPGMMGKNEVTLVKKRDLFLSRGTDHVAHLAWKELRDAWLHRSSDMVDGESVESGINCVLQVIEEAKKEKYPAEYGRDVVREIADRAVDKLNKGSSSLSLGRWSGRNTEEILTYGTDVTLWLDALHDVEEEPPHRPVELRGEDGRVRLTIRTQFRLATRVPRLSEKWRWWQTVGLGASFGIGTLGDYYRVERGWYRHHIDVVGNENEIAKKMADAGRGVIMVLKELAVGSDISRYTRP